MPGAAVLTTAYLPSIDYFRVLQARDEVRIDAWEHFRKQTIRNRCLVLSANGVQPLTVPVVHRGRAAIPVRDLRISYRQPWMRQHWHALCAAYNRSAFFEHYREGLERILFSEPAFLFDLNQACLAWLLDITGTATRVGLTDAYRDDYGADDFRTLSEKGRAPGAGTPYPQVFASKFGFVPGLSVADLVFNAGGAVAAFLRAPGP